MSNTSGNQGITGQLTNRCAVVTGGNKGMGLEICRQLAACGVFVILTARDEKRGLDAVENLKKSGLSNVVYHQLDLKDSSSISSLANFIATHYTKLDILVNNAADNGVVMDADAFKALPHGFVDINDENPELSRGVMKQTHEKAEDCLKTNYYGTKAVTEALLPFLQRSNLANIVNVSTAYSLLMFIHNEEVKSELNNVESLTEERLDELLQCYLRDFKEDKLQANGWPITVSAYKMSKAAVNAYTRMLARKFPEMRINCVHPGYVKTDFTGDTGLLTAEEGAKGAVKLALLPDDGPTGHFLYDMNMTTFWISNTFFGGKHYQVTNTNLYSSSLVSSSYLGDGVSGLSSASQGKGKKPKLSLTLASGHSASWGLTFYSASEKLSRPHRWRMHSQLLSTENGLP